MQVAGWVPVLAFFAITTAWAGENAWTKLGPASAAVTALAVDPGNAAVVYAATGTGLFKSVDEGQTWSALNPGPPCCVLTLVPEPPSDTQTEAALYVITRAGSVLKSIDGGTNWILLNSGLPVDEAGNYGITSLVIDPRHPGTLYAGRGVRGGGVYKSMDGGANWTPMILGIPDIGVLALAIDPQQPDTVYASTRSNGVFQTTDGGASWNAASSGLSFARSDYMAILAVDARDSNTLYAAGNADQDSDDPDSGLYKSADAGASWTSLNFFATVTAMAVDPRRAGALYVGTYRGLSKTTDGGRSWRTVRSRVTADAFGSALITALAIDPQNPDTQYAAGGYSGVLKSSDAGESWTPINPELRSASPTGVLTLRAPAQTPGVIYAGTDTGVFKTTDSGATWTPVNSGLPNALYGHLPVSILEIDPNAPGTVYALDPCCQEMYRSTDGGASWAGTLQREASGLIVRGLRLNVNAFAIDPRNPRTLYIGGSFVQSGQPAGGRGVLKSADAGSSWIVVNAGLPDTSDGFSTSLAIDPQNPSTLYMGTFNHGIAPQGSGVFKTTTGGLSWRNTGLTGHTRVDILGVDPRNANTVYARASDYSLCCISIRLFKTTNAGTSWSAADSGLSGFVNALAIDPQNPATVYAGTGAGVFRSTDGGASWNAVSSGLTILGVTALAINARDSNTVYAGTLDGVFALTVVQ